MKTQPDIITKQPQGLYTQHDITARGAFSKSHLYNMMARGQFPQPTLVVGSRFTRWASAECDQWFSDPAAFIATNSKVAA